MPASADAAFIASLRRHARRYGGASDAQLAQCRSVARMRAWLRAYVREVVPFLWSRAGELDDVTPRQRALLLEMCAHGFLYNSGSPEENERAPSRLPALLPPASLGYAGEVFGPDPVEYLDGWIENGALARMDLSAPLVALVGGGRRLVVCGAAREAPPGRQFTLQVVTTRGHARSRARAQLEERIGEEDLADDGAAPVGARAALAATHTRVMFQLFGDSPTPLYELVAARLRA